MTTWGGTTKLTPFAKTDKEPQDHKIQALNTTSENNSIDNPPFMTPPGSDCTCRNFEKHRV
jgi:hypothetical protein